MTPASNPSMQHSTTDPTSREGGYEATDVVARGVWLTGLGLIVCCIGIMLIMMLMYHMLQRSHDAADQTSATQEVVPSVAQSPSAFPGPRLQVDPAVDLAVLRQWEDQELSHYGWIDRKAGVVRIPIDRAMDLIVQRGLPFAGQPGAPTPSRTVLDLQQSRPSDWAKEKQKPQ